MRIYMAGFYAGRGLRMDGQLGTPHFRISNTSDPAWVLESFHYIGGNRIPEMIRKDKQTIFLDSGAFSMFTQDVKVDLEAYARFCHANKDILHLISNLDAIGEGKEEITYANQQRLEQLDIDVHPVHHARDRDPWLKKYLDQGYDYIFLGGMVPENTPYLLEWLDHIWKHYLINPDKTPRVKVHGFGLTVLKLMFRYPWFSLDSTSWVMTSRFGSIYIDLPHRDVKVDFSSRSPKQEDIDSWHYLSLGDNQKRAVLDRLEELEAIRPKQPELEAELEHMMGFKQGYNPTALAESYGWRDHFNINYFKRAQERGVKIFDPGYEQVALF